MAISPAGQLVDSTRLLGDPVALRGRMAEDGYLFFRRLLHPDEVASTGATVLGHLQKAGWTEHGDDPVTARPVAPVRAVRMRDLFGNPTYTRIFLNPHLNELAYRSGLAAMMGELLGPLGFCYPLRIPRIVYPTTFAPRQPGNFVHKDYGSVQDMFTCWVPFGRVPAELGGLALRPGSQRSERVLPRPLTRLPPGWVTTDYEPGDVLVFHCLTSHAALPNRSDRMRLSVEYRWQLADQPAPRRLIIGPTGVEIGSRLFRRYRWWRPVPRQLQFFDEELDSGRGRLPAAPSRFVQVDTRRWRRAPATTEPVTTQGPGRWAAYAERVLRGKPR